MSIEEIIILVTVALCFPPLHFFIGYYGVTRRWWDSLEGRSVMTSTVGLAALVDLALIRLVMGEDYFLRDVLRVIVYSVITGGAWMMCYALLTSEKRHGRHNAFRTDAQNNES